MNHAKPQAQPIARAKPALSRQRQLKRVIPPLRPPVHQDMDVLSGYIHHKWKELTRDHENLFLGMLSDEKVAYREGTKPILYISRQENYEMILKYLSAMREQVLQKVRKGEIQGVSETQIPEIDLRVLPEDHTTIPADEHGLLYLPYPYVVPGGRFNETYGWDSAFIVRGLVLDGQYDIAKNVVDNKIYSIRHYGMILNANRSYYLGRSQAPFLTNKVLDIYRNYDKLISPGLPDATAWLKSTLDGIHSYYQLWTMPPHIHRQSGLSYYNDMNEKPSVEVEFSEAGHYSHALGLLRNMYRDKLAREERGETMPVTYQERKDAYYLALYYQAEHPGLSREEIESLPLEQKDALTGKFYRGDRAMRASGFDPSRRFGFFNVDVIHHLPVCLNTLLYIMEMETAEIYQILAQNEPDGRNHEGHLWSVLSRQWKELGQKRKKRINAWLWDEAEDSRIEAAAQFPGYRDYNFNHTLCDQYDIPFHRNYVFATAFYPMWAGIATTARAKQVVKHIYPKLITENGLMTSNRETGCQWDAPFAWAPLQVIAVRGLIRYGYVEEALAIAYGFLRTVQRGFDATGKIFEKYDMRRGDHNVSDKIDKGYNINVEGFGWTNAAVIELLQVVQLYGELSERP